MHDSSNCPICRGLPVDGSMSDQAFEAFLESCLAELADKQARFNQRIAGESRWAYDLADCSLTVGTQRFRMTPVGTHSPQQQTWLWAWANEDYPAIAREASRQIQALFTVTGFRVFIEPGTDADRFDAQDFTAMAVHQLDAIGFYRLPSAGPTLFLAVHGDE